MEERPLVNGPPVVDMVRRIIHRPEERVTTELIVRCGNKSGPILRRLFWNGSGFEKEVFGDRPSCDRRPS